MAVAELKSCDPGRAVGWAVEDQIRRSAILLAHVRNSGSTRQDWHLSYQCNCAGSGLDWRRKRTPLAAIKRTLRISGHTFSGATSFENF